MSANLRVIKQSNCKYCGNLSANIYCCNACELLDSGFEKLSQARNHTDEKHQYLDLDENQSLFRINGLGRRFKFYIFGIQCSSCVHLIEKIPDYNSHCLSSRLNMGTCELIVELDSVGKLSEIATLIENMGYTFSPIKSGSSAEENFLKESHADLKRIAVAGALAGNIMVASAAIYTGAYGELLVIFKWLSFILFLPVLFYVALPFYRGAWASLKLQKVHIDLPIVIALLTSSLFSFYNLFAGSDQFYFDSTAGFIFLILTARYFVKKAQHRFLSPQTFHSQIKTESYVLSDSGQSVLSENIKPGNLVIISQDRTIPVDGRLVSDFALIDTSFMSGESVPYAFTRGMKLYAGYKLLSASTVMICDRSVSETRISELLEKSYERLLAKNDYLSLADLLSERLLVSVLFISIILFVVVGYLINFTEAFNRALALIVVACPCALAFGSPLTLAMAFRKSQRKGISVRDANVFEKISTIQNVFFDKTGTLTYGQLQVCEVWPEQLSPEVSDILISLEKISYHPVGFAIRSHFKNFYEYYNFSQHEEIFGVGVRGYLASDLYELKTLPSNLYDDSIDMAVALYKNKQILCRIYFQDKIREEAKKTIQLLQAQRKNCYLISGDKKRKALAVAEQCGLPKEHVFAELYPEDKKEILGRYPYSLMIGDGINDTLAMSHSEVSVAIKGSAELALASSDVFFLRSGLSPLLDLITINQNIHATLKRNLTFSLFYNFTAGCLAVFGFINPLWAAVLMPVSTFLILFSTLWGFRE